MTTDHFVVFFDPKDVIRCDVNKSFDVTTVDLDAMTTRLFVLKNLITFYSVVYVFEVVRVVVAVFHGCFFVLFIFTNRRYPLILF